ncbi:MAG TPA: ParA family protein [Pseudomonadales bacterium]|nr:ParA family protein [Pseudomonadales bacterium]
MSAADAPNAFPPPLAGNLRILVVNAKGGSGKTTLATNLAVCYARHDIVTALVDHDPQGSATQWLAARPPDHPPIGGVEGFRVSEPGVTRSFLMRPAIEARRVVVDTPAALLPAQFGTWLTEADRIVVPVLPSSIDIKAATRFIGALLLDPRFRARRIPLAVVANRVRRNTLVFEKLRRFLGSLQIPFVTTLRDTQNYVRCTETGEGIFDDPSSRTREDRDALMTLLQWLEKPTTPQQR